MADVFLARKCRNGLVKVLIGDITKTEADVMATAANNRLAGREGVDSQIHQAAGEGLREACDEIARERRKENLQPCPVGTAVVTDAFDLNAGKLIHVVGPDCRRPNQDEGRRGLLKKAYDALFQELQAMKKVSTIATPPLSMDVFAYPHREGARMTMEIVLSWMDGPDSEGIDEFLIVTQEMNFINNLRTIYRESEDQFAGSDITRQYR
tara:strand:+ start:603 stop:1229 length:627 start_codon:yes stop_codon:yes gene_type:complete